MEEKHDKVVCLFAIHSSANNLFFHQVVNFDQIP